MSLFEKAARGKYRFATSKGQLSVENLFDLNLTSLDEIAKGINRELKATEEESFIGKKSPENATLAVKLDILKRVIEIKQGEEEAKTKRIANRAKREQLQQLLIDKQNAAMQGLSIEQIQAQLAELED